MRLLTTYWPRFPRSQASTQTPRSMFVGSANGESKISRFVLNDDSTIHTSGTT